MQPVSDLDFSRHFRMMVKAAITNNSVFTTRHNGELRRHTGAIPAHHFLDEGNGLLALGINA